MNKRLLSSLDSWLDTRLATVRMLSEPAAERLLASNEYWLREHTDWGRLTGGLVTNEQFEAQYAKRDLETLRHAVVTGLLAPMQKILADYDINMMNGMGKGEITLEINIWPYDLDSDYIEILQGVFADLFGPSQLVTYISVPMEELTPAFMTGRYSAAVLYEFHEWLRVHTEAVYAGRHTSFSLVGPKLFEKDPGRLTVEERQLELQRFHKDFLVFMHFEFIDTKYFSVFRP